MGRYVFNIVICIVTIFTISISIIPQISAYDFEFEENVPNTFTINGTVITSGSEICDGVSNSTNPNFPYDKNGHKQVWVKFNKNALPDHASAKVYVKDTFANTSPSQVDFVCVNLSSQKSGDNLNVVLRETDINTGFFESISYTRFSSSVITNDYNFGPDLFAQPGNNNDIITAEYKNEHSSTSDTIEIVRSPAEMKRGGWGNYGYVTPPSQLKNEAARIVCVDDIELSGKGDGVCDEWEAGSRLSISFNGDTYTGPECGGVNQDTCPSNTKVDIFVEVDFNGDKYSEQELDTVIEKVKGVFSGYDSGRLDPATGMGLYIPVQLHVQKDSGDKQYIPEQITFPGNADFPNGFNVTKTYFFGTSQERGSTVAPPNQTTPPPNWAFQQKSQVFHYLQFVDKIENLGSTTGYGELWGNDMIVAKQPMLWGGDTNELTGTTLHELGHNIGLNHGGYIDDQVNCKPNYLSAMSYTFQMPYYLQSLWKPDLSWTQLNTLPENGLWEPTGLWDYPNGIGYTFYYSGEGFRYALAGDNIDWNGNGVIDTQNSLVDINDLNIAGCGDSPLDSLQGHQDWGADLKYNFRFTPNFASSGIHTDPEELDEMDKETIDDIIEQLNSTGTSPPYSHPHKDFGTFEAYTSDPPIIDGIEDAIWSNADTINMKLDLPHPVITSGWYAHGDEYDTDIQLSMMNDDKNIYVKVRAEGDSQIDWERTWSEFRFSIDHVHDLNNAEMDTKSIRIDPEAETIQDYFHVWKDGKLIKSDKDIDLHGKTDITYDYANGENWSVLEFSMPLCSNDVNDFCLKTGDELGVRYLHTTFHDDWIKGDGKAQAGQYAFPGWAGSTGPDKGFHFVVSSSPASESIKIKGYDATDTNKLEGHDNVVLNTISGISGNGILAGEHIAIYMMNDGNTTVELSEVKFGGTVYSFNGSGVSLPEHGMTANNRGFWLVDNTSDSTIKTTAEIQTGEQVTMILQLDGNFKVGRDVQMLLSTSNGNTFVGTTIIGQQSG